MLEIPVFASSQLAVFHHSIVFLNEFAAPCRPAHAFADACQPLIEWIDTPGRGDKFCCSLLVASSVTEKALHDWQTFEEHLKIIQFPAAISSDFLFTLWILDD